MFKFKLPKIKLVVSHLVKVRYKSGAMEEFYCTRFTWKKDGSSMSVAWDAEFGRKNRPMWLNVDAVESIWLDKSCKKFKFYCGDS